tara:strand:+ start:3476 stop:4258 length:783 start_codon:yes stop_codon:yes gene_type:complete
MKYTNRNVHNFFHSQGQNIITIASGKGGVGKTWISTTLAHALSKSGKKVLLFDADLGLANIDVQLGINPNKDLSGVVAGKYSLQDAIMRVPNTKFDLLPGKSGSGILTVIKSDKVFLVKENIEKISKYYDWVIADLSAGIDSNVRTLTYNNGIILVVTTNDPTSLTDAYVYIKILNMKYPNSDIRILVNMAKSKKEGLNTFQTIYNSCKNFLKIKPELAGIIRNDHCVKSAIRNQELLLNKFPSAVSSNDMMEIKKYVLK